MSGYGKPDEEQENAQAMVDNAIALARMMIPSGPSAKICGDCGNAIPEARREAQPGCRYCVVCQVWHDKMPNLKVVTKML
jgi:phage/conjugal plasmid C-4 type zinc finger TraR family protein